MNGLKVVDINSDVGAFEKAAITAHHTYVNSISDIIEKEEKRLIASGMSADEARTDVIIRYTNSCSKKL